MNRTEGFHEIFRERRLRDLFSLIRESGCCGLLVSECHTHHTCGHNALKSLYINAALFGNQQRICHSLPHKNNFRTSCLSRPGIDNILTQVYWPHRPMTYQNIHHPQHFTTSTKSQTMGIYREIRLVALIATVKVAPANYGNVSPSSSSLGYFVDLPDFTGLATLSSTRVTGFPLFTVSHVISIPTSLQPEVSTIWSSVS